MASIRKMRERMKLAAQRGKAEPMCDNSAFHYTPAQVTEEDYPGQNDEIRREHLIRQVVEVADRILTDGADGSVEEIDYLTARVAQEWAGKVLCAARAKLLRKDIEGRNGK